MNKILHQITIEESSDKVFEAIVNEQALKSWWTVDVEATPEVGSIALFGFFDRSTIFKMKIEELKPGEFVKWSCVDGPDEWIGTELTFNFEASDEGGTIVQFSHHNWKETCGQYPVCNTTWGALMFHLKDHVENGTVNPFFKQ